MNGVNITFPGLYNPSITALLCYRVKYGRVYKRYDSTMVLCYANILNTTQQAASCNGLCMFLWKNLCGTGIQYMWPQMLLAMSYILLCRICIFDAAVM